MIQSIKLTLVALAAMFLVACGGGSDNSTDSGGGSGGPVAEACTPERVYGTWQVTVEAAGQTQTEIVTIGPDDNASGNLTLDGNQFSYTEDGITLNGSISANCNSLSGTFSGGGLSGTFNAVKI